MYDLFVLGARYIFIGGMLYFIWQGAVCIYGERRKSPYAVKAAIVKQRIITVVMHILAFLILSYQAADKVWDLDVLVTGGFGLLFLGMGWLGTFVVFRQGDSLLWNGVFFLLDVSLIMLQRLSPALTQKQLIWLYGGLTLALLIPTFFKVIPRFERLEKAYLSGGWLLFLLTFVFGREIYGAKNWIAIGDFSFQPSEIIKFLFIFYLASVFRKKLTWKEYIFPTVMSIGYVLALVLQKDLGGALIFFMTYMVMVYIATGKEILFFGGISAASVGAFLAYRVFLHVQIRVETWINPWADIDNRGYQITQSLFAIGTWGLFGSGLTRGYPRYIPAVTTDFIFAAICEEFGTIFGIGIIGIFIMVFFRGVIISLRCKRRFYSLLAAGATNILAFQTFLIIGGVIKLIPLTGVTLPFVSYGGSSIIVSMLMIGLLQWIYVFYEKQEILRGEYIE